LDISPTPAARAAESAPIDAAPIDAALIDAAPIDAAPIDFEAASLTATLAAVAYFNSYATEGYEPHKL